MDAKVEKPETIRDLGPVDISGISSLVARLSERVWEQEDSRKENDYDCFHHTRHIVFRFIEGNRDPRDFYSTPIWDVWRPQLLPLMEKLVEPYGFARPEFPKVMLARLAAGHVIDLHTDGEGSHEYTHKIHVPLQTNPKATFTTNGETFHLETGLAYEVNNIARHAVANRGEEDRIHLIFEVFDRKDELVAS